MRSSTGRPSTRLTHPESSSDTVAVSASRFEAVGAQPPARIGVRGRIRLGLDERRSGRDHTDAKGVVLDVEVAVPGRRQASSRRGSPRTNRLRERRPATMAAANVQDGPSVGLPRSRVTPSTATWGDAEAGHQRVGGRFDGTRAIERAPVAEEHLHHVAGRVPCGSQAGPVAVGCGR